VQSVPAGKQLRRDKSLSRSSFDRELRPFCRTADFRRGEILRRGGQHYNEMLWLTKGQVKVTFDARRFSLGAGSPVGEIGFLRGCPATATVTADDNASALIIDDVTLAKIEEQRPDLAAEFLRHLAEVAEERTSENVVFTPTLAWRPGDGVTIQLCRTKEMKLEAQRLRYQVYVDELGRDSPYADHERRIIIDHLDEFAHTFLAVEEGRTIGTLRGNLTAEGSVGYLEELYGMTLSSKHPVATAICTKFAIKRENRGGPAAMGLIAAMVRFGLRHNVEECYIDCIPPLLHYYRAIGFKISGPEFFHREHGLSYPMVVDVTRRGRTLSEGLKPSGYLQLYIVAQAFKWWDRMRHSSFEASRRTRRQ